MLPCSRCGRSAPVGALHCPACGFRLEAAPGAATQGVLPRGTLIGVRSPLSREPEAEATPPNAWSAGAAPARPGIGAHTRLGFQSPVQTHPAPVGAVTQLGHRAPQIGSSPNPPAAAGPRLAAGRPLPEPRPPASRAPEAARVLPPRAAAPAPVADGGRREEAERAIARQRLQRERRVRRRGDPLERRGFFAALTAPPRTDTSRLSHWLLGAALAGLCAALFAVVTLGSQKQVEAEVVSVDGQDLLELRCPRCDDGDRVRLAEAEAVFRNQVATLALDGQLPVGLNHLEPVLVAGQLLGDQTLALDIPVHFRLRAATEGLTADVPTLAVEVETNDDTVVELDGRTVPIRGGRGRLELDVAQQLVGEASALATFERAVVYHVKPKRGRTYSGKLNVAFGALPLVVEAPGPTVVVDSSSFTLAGRTAAGATLKLDGRPLPVDAEGGFAQLLNVDSEGETTIWLSTSMPGHATRRYPIRVRRVASLEAEANRFLENASQDYARVARAPEDERGLAVVFEGTIRSLRQLPYSTKAFLDVTSGCSGECRVQLSHGSRLKLSDDTRVVAYGHVAGSATTPDGSAIPEVRTLFVLQKR